MNGAPSGWSRFGLLGLLAVAGCLAMGFANLHLLTREIDTSSIPEEPGDQATHVFAGELAQPPAADRSDYPVTLARPLFRATRRPPPAVAETPAAKRPEPARRRTAKLPDDLQLVGIMKENGKTGRALIRSSKSPTGEWIEVGHVLEGWRLSRVEQRSIQFESGGQKQELSLFRDGEGQTD
jgi:hypothetical protein